MNQYCCKCQVHVNRIDRTDLIRRSHSALEHISVSRHLMVVDGGFVSNTTWFNAWWSFIASLKRFSTILLISIGNVIVIVEGDDGCGGCVVVDDSTTTNNRYFTISIEWWIKQLYIITHNIVFCNSVDNFLTKENQSIINEKWKNKPWISNLLVVVVWHSEHHHHHCRRWRFDFHLLHLLHHLLHLSLYFSTNDREHCYWSWMLEREIIDWWFWWLLDECAS